MKFSELLNSNKDRAVSPVIGVILMVAITVILAAVIGTFVLGLGDQVQQTSPNAQFNFDFDNDAGNEALEVTHDGGDGINTDELFLRGDVQVNGTDFSWGANGVSDDVVRAGTGVIVNTVDTDDTYQWDGGYQEGDTVRVVWEDADSDRSSTLRTWSQ